MFAQNDLENLKYWFQAKMECFATDFELWIVGIVSFLLLSSLHHFRSSRIERAVGISIFHDLQNMEQNEKSDKNKDKKRSEWPKNFKRKLDIG